MGYGVSDISRLGPAAQRQILLKLLEQNRAKCAAAVRQEAMREGIRFTIPLNPVTKKNSQRIIRAGNHYKLLPSKAFEKYEKNAGPYIPYHGEKISEPCEIVYLFYMRENYNKPTGKKKIDLTNLEEALDDVLVSYGLLADDNSRIIVSHDGSRVYHDSKNPRTEVTIRFLDGGEEP